MAGTHCFGSPCMFIFTDKPAIFAASTSLCVCSKTLFQSMPSLEQASSELGNAFNPLVANLKRPWCRRLLFLARRCIIFSYIFKKQASQPCFETAAVQIIYLHRGIYPNRVPSPQTAPGSMLIKSIAHLK